ncbi:ABC transporter substrate-binding protein [Granulosicoccus antarcticus]|uniref:Hemin-binding periplasmic protein HmuT n=1 Tax=Granulosicoccus antarcticus IMCC3135 TaxID=1192854 RepID=A0A2Z2NXF7_9GAMM|nr:ABC transporter substrate-binding protein [Granulosicoccus antarcticus]ASJ71824.1 Hemin-binding periplasmic protein HmuT [Granulosicoccus antarcticus IMCC3135]
MMNAHDTAPEALVHRGACVAECVTFVSCWTTGIAPLALVLTLGLHATATAGSLSSASSTTESMLQAPGRDATVIKPALLSEQRLPRVMSTNLCADMLLLGLADASQIVSLSYQSQDPKRSSQASLARNFASNQASAEEVIASQPDIVLASRRWQAQHQVRLFERFGINIINVPYPKDWASIFDSLEQIGEAIGRGARAAELIADTQRRLQQVEASSAARSALYLRGNGGTAASGTFIDALFQALAVSNKASEYGVTGWGRVSLESIVLDPPDAFMLSRTEHDTSLARSGVIRHPLLRDLLFSKPVLSLSNLDAGCSDWRQVETVEKLAGELSSQSGIPAQGAQP